MTSASVNPHRAYTAATPAAASADPQLRSLPVAYTDATPLLTNRTRT
jgi:hypothetical protein